MNYFGDTTLGARVNSDESLIDSTNIEAAWLKSTPELVGFQQNKSEKRELTRAPKSALNKRQFWAVSFIFRTDLALLMDRRRRLDPPRRHRAWRHRLPLVVVSTTGDIADFKQERFEAGACNGFSNVIKSRHERVNNFVDQVVPILKERGRFHLDYQGPNEGDNLGRRPLTGDTHA